MRQPLALVAAIVLLAAAAAARAAAAVDIAVKDAWIRTPPNGASTAAAYATLVNRGLASDRLTGARTGAAAGVTVHDMSMTGGVMRMRAMPAGLAIAGSSTVRLSPNGRHLMMMGVKHPLKSGDRVRVVLHFQRAGDVPATFAVHN